MAVVVVEEFKPEKNLQNRRRKEQAGLAALPADTAPAHATGHPPVHSFVKREKKKKKNDDNDDDSRDEGRWRWIVSVFCFQLCINEERK